MTESAAFWFAPTRPNEAAATDDDEDWDAGGVNFGLDDITDIKALIPDTGDAKVGGFR